MYEGLCEEAPLARGASEGVLGCWRFGRGMALVFLCSVERKGLGARSRREWPEFEGAFDLGESSTEEKEATERRLARIRLSLSSPRKKRKRRQRIHQNLTLGFV